MYLYNIQDNCQVSLIEQISAQNHLLRIDLSGSGRYLGFSPNIIQGTLVLLDTEQPTKKREIEVNKNFPVSCFKFNKDGSKIAISHYHDDLIRIYSIQQEKEPTIERYLKIKGQPLDFKFCPITAQFSCLSTHP